MRMLIEMSLLLFLPFILYGVWGMFAVKRGKRRTVWDRAPFKILSLIGLSMVLGLVFWQTSYGKAKPYATWIPDKMINGTFVPGHFVEKPKQDE